MAIRILPREELPVELEYEAPILSQFSISEAVIAEKVILFRLKSKRTSCRAGNIAASRVAHAVRRKVTGVAKRRMVPKPWREADPAVVNWSECAVLKPRGAIRESFFSFHGHSYAWRSYPQLRQEPCLTLPPPQDERMKYEYLFKEFDPSEDDDVITAWLDSRGRDGWDAVNVAPKLYMVEQGTFALPMPRLPRTGYTFLMKRPSAN